MKTIRSLGLLARVFAVAFLLLFLKTIATPCDEACSAEAPTCECLCVCYGKDLATPANDHLSPMCVAQFIIQFESSQQSLLLTSDIFRPPIA